MNIEKSIENIVAKCDNYIDPQLAICIIRDNYTMGSNNIGELKKYGIENEDSYVEKVLKVLKHENIFITFGMLAFIPMFNECDIFSIEDKTISLSNEEFLAQQTRVLKITPETRTANAIGDFNGALEDMPHYCITIGINEISHARKIRLGCFRNWHRAVVRRAVYGEQTSEFPVSLLQNHSDINLKITEFVASLTD